MGTEGWLKERVDAIIAAGKLTREEWHELFDRVWEDGQNTPAEAAEMSRLLEAINAGTVRPIR